MATPQKIFLADYRDCDKKVFEGLTVLFFCNDMKAAALEIAQKSKGCIVLGEITWERFPDSFPNLKISDAPLLTFCDVAFLACLNKPDVIFEQLAVIHALPRYFAKSFKVVLPYFSTGTMERVVYTGEVATAKTLARMLSMTPPCQTGPAQLCILDIHTLQNQFYFSDDMLVRLRSCVPLLLKKMTERKDDYAVAFPDDGAHKRFGKKFKGYPLIICHKVRLGDKRIVQIKDGEPKGKHVIVVDDLVQSGGTMIKCAEALYAAGAKDVSGFCTHGVFPNESWKKFVHDPKTGKRGAGNFTKFWLTNSLPGSHHGQEPFETLSIADSVGDFINSSYGK